MCALDQIDSCAQLFDDIAQDPDFYSAKAFLRETYPDARLIEIVPGPFEMAEVMIIMTNGWIVITLIGG
ncbi:hypothetical protein [uncultured Roseibium sp.]|uniref:hypothetical protein n=1 Tax=uncultured Roseibium sp. TaxID=1936171 RepID=UPI002607C112|nr:hypothetical protein [uncultured Roseibium sp.]